MTITLYAWATPNGRKISVALEEMELPYAVKPINIGKGEQFQPEFLRISPNNKIPAIVDPDGPDGAPISVFESGAVLLYLGEKTGKFLPKSLRERVPVLEWLMWQNGRLRSDAWTGSSFRDAGVGKRPALRAQALLRRNAAPVLGARCAARQNGICGGGRFQWRILRFSAGRGAMNGIKSTSPIIRMCNAGIKRCSRGRPYSAALR